MALLPFLQAQTGKLAKLTVISLPSVKGAIDLAGLIKEKKVNINDFIAASVSVLLDAKPKIFEVMYNPTTYGQSYKAQNLCLPTIGKQQAAIKLQRFRNEKVSFDLFFDATSASPSSGTNGVKAATIAAESPRGVDSVIKDFLNATIGIGIKTHDANNLIVIWGPFIFRGRLESADVSYTLFDRGGRPLRATVKATFIQAHFAEEVNNLIKQFQSPDVTKTHVVKAGDTLPLIAKNEYDNESYYMELARVNNLKNYRNLVPGQVLVLPAVSKNKASV
ncbi:MAG: hypothetical protein FD123_2554 [Bacteroidetes bacterium]|nr:MAG: hypothetical protein FD123_2554 [Bacteroidota bacterium]